MYKLGDYITRGSNFVNNQLFPQSKKLSSFMIYATDLCDSRCRHCLIWAKRPVKFLPKEKIFDIVSNSRCISSSTVIGLEGGEFMLHPESAAILDWFKHNHPKYDLLSNCLKPQQLIEAVKKNKPHRLWVSLDGMEETYRYMRGRDGFNSVTQVIETLKDEVPVSVMFTLSPYNDYHDLDQVASYCKKAGVDLRVGIYNDISFFDTMDQAHTTGIGSRKNLPPLSFSGLEDVQNGGQASPDPPGRILNEVQDIPGIIKEFKENYDFLVLYENWRQQKLRLRCFSIFDNLIVLPNGDVPLCQNLDVKLGNIYNNSLDEILAMPETISTQKFHSHNCNQCWINYHRKFDVVLYRNLEKFFGRTAVRKVFGYYQWSDDAAVSYTDSIK
jgi:MoaA/NifB/PqqE/SkfB family radical SAM enzyme